jgi:hypothetical protein
MENHVPNPKCLIVLVGGFGRSMFPILRTVISRFLQGVQAESSSLSLQ